MKNSCSPTGCEKCFIIPRALPWAVAISDLRSEDRRVELSYLIGHETIYSDSRFEYRSVELSYLIGNGMIYSDLRSEDRHVELSYLIGNGMIYSDQRSESATAQGNALGKLKRKLQPVGLQEFSDYSKNSSWI